MSAFGKLRSLPLFDGVSDEELHLLADIGDAGSCEAGHVLIRIGGAGRNCHLITRGTASVTRGQVELERVGPGDVVGELAGIDDKPRSASVTALEPLEFLTYTPAQFADLTDRVPALRRRLTRTIVRRLRATESAWDQLASDPDLLLDALLELQQSRKVEVAERAAADAATVIRREAAVAGTASPGLEVLTPAERRVAELVAQGLSNRAIAARLFLSPHTVTSHVRHAFTKLGVNSRVSLTAALLVNR